MTAATDPRVSTKKLKISAIRFLNPAPLMWDFEHPPQRMRLGERYRIHRSMPSQCAEELASGTADIGLVPIAAYATTPGLAIIPGCTVASLDHVRSILLVVKRPEGIGAVRSVAADTASRASNAYAKIIFRKFYGIDPTFVPHAPDLDAMLQDCDAAILIGDPALLALEDRTARLARTGNPLTYIDLAHEWKQHTGAPWVSAFWAVRPQAIEDAGLNQREVVDDFVQSRDHGMAHVEDIVREWTPRVPVPAATIREYLSQNIHYVLDDACLAGLEVFFRYAAECGVLPSAPPLRFL
ncbi:MAG: menaquinone biosynthetic enzyme MqnA/MqnD family protein [Acidobacteriaceae bacterium]